MKSTAKYLMLGLLFLALGFAVGRLTAGMNNDIAITDKPLFFVTAENNMTYAIPKGTPLHYVEPVQEGGDIFKLYLYYSGEPLEAHRSPHRWEMRAVEVYPE